MVGIASDGAHVSTLLEKSGDLWVHVDDHFALFGHF